MADVHRIDAAYPTWLERGTHGRPAFGALALTLFASLMLVGMMVSPVVMALLGGTLLTTGLLLAVALWIKGTASTEQAGAWDVAGLLVFLGFAAGTMCGASAFLG